MVAGPPLPQGDMSVERLAHALESLDFNANCVVAIAHHEAFRYASGFIASAHLLLGLLAVDPAPVLTQRPGQDRPVLAELRSQLELLMGAHIQPRARVLHLPYTPHARAILINAADRAQRIQSAITTTGHLWSALAASEGSLAARALDALHLLGQEPS